MTSAMPSEQSPPWPDAGLLPPGQQNVPALLQARAATLPDAPAVAFPGLRLDGAALLEAVAGWAG
ncbi:MAG: hypothetical protein ACK4KW_14340, partial [Gemmobacter sp.]